MNLSSRNPLVMADYSFNTRETYLEQVALWKFDYQINTKYCRKTRQALKDAMRTASKAGFPVGSLTKIENARQDRRNAKWAATKMIEKRHEMKIEAQRQYAEQRKET